MAVKQFLDAIIPGRSTMRELMPEQCFGCWDGRELAKVAELSATYALSDRFLAESDEVASIRQSVMGHQAAESTTDFLEFAARATKLGCPGVKKILGIPVKCRIPNDKQQTNEGEI